MIFSYLIFISPIRLCASLLPTRTCDQITLEFGDCLSTHLHFTSLQGRIICHRRDKHFISLGAGNRRRDRQMKLKPITHGLFQACF